MSYTQFNPNSKGLEELNLSPDEVNKFSDALKKKEFVDMLGDYMKEISDPANKKEYDDYLKQLEREGDLPEGTQLIDPREGFCIKTNVINKKNKKSTQKLFINICQHDKVQKPSSVNSTQGKTQGQQWSLPYVAGKVRLDQDNKSEVCQTIEVCFHDQVIEFVRRNQGFEKIVCDTAIEAAVKQIKERDDIVSKDYKIMNNLKCKGGKPATLTVRSQFLQNPKQAYEFEEEQNKRQKSETQGPKLFQEFMKAQNVREEEKKKEKQEAQKVETQEEEKPKKQLKKINAPQYKILYSYNTDYGDFLEVSKSKRKLPQSIQVCIDLPNSEGIQNLKLDIDQKLMIFQIPNKHYLEIKLPYDVDQEAGDAKYDKKNRTLKISLPLSKNNVYDDPSLEDNIQNEDHLEQENVQKEEQQQIQQKEQQIQQKDQQIQQKEQQIQQKEQQNQSIQQKDQSIQQKDQSIQQEEQSIQQEEQQVQQNQEQQKNENNSLLEVQQNKQSILDICNEEKAEIKEYKKEFIQEIETAQQDEQKEEQQKEKQKRQLEYKTQQTEDYYFFMFNLKNYNKDLLKACISNQQIRLRYEDDNDIMYQAIQINKEIDQQQSKVDLVTDYIIVKIKKLVDEEWQDNYNNLQETYDEFQSNFDSQQEQIQLMEKQIQDQINEENQIKALKEKEWQEEQEYIKQQQQKQLENQQSMEGKQKDPQLNKIQQISNSLQFVEFDCPFAYTLD